MITSADKGLYQDIEWIPTGFQGLDKIMGGGIPMRRITEISGVYSVGKSTLALQIIAQAQKAGKKCLWADTEFQYTPDYAETLGVDNKKLELLQERLAEDVLDTIEEWADKHKNAVIVLDSVGGLLPRAEAEKSADGKVIGGQAKLIATFCRKIVPILAINNIALLILNHQLIDLMSGKLKTSGGAKLEYSKSVWISLRNAGSNLKRSEDVVGVVINAEVRKNKLVPTLKQSTNLELVFGQGFNKTADLVQDALDKGVITKEGQFFYFQGERIARGQNGLREAMKDEALQSKVLEKLNAQV